MPSDNRNQQVGKNSPNKGESTANSSRAGRKAPGTRWGTLQDWRTASNDARNTSGRHGHAIRDGRQ